MVQIHSPGKCYFLNKELLNLDKIALNEEIHELPLEKHDLAQCHSQVALWKLDNCNNQYIDPMLQLYFSILWNWTLILKKIKFINYWKLGIENLHSKDKNSKLKA